MNRILKLLMALIISVATVVCDDAVAQISVKAENAAPQAASQGVLLSGSCHVTADSYGIFGRNNRDYGGPHHSFPQLLTSGPTESGNWKGRRWITQMDQPHPHWVWIDLGKPKRIERVVVRCSSASNYPLELRGQYSTDGGVTLNDLFVAKDLVVNKKELFWEFRFKPVVTDNFRLLIEKSTSEYRPEYTQLSQIEVYGQEVESAVEQQAPKAAQSSLVARSFEPQEQKDLQIEERENEVELRSPWQRLVFDKHRPCITAISWDSIGEGDFKLNLLGRKVGKFQPFIEPAIGPALECAKAELRRDGNVLRYGPFEMRPGLWMTWEIKVGAKTLEMVAATESTKPIAAKAGVVRMRLDAGQTPTAPFYKPGKIGFVGMPALLNAPDSGHALLQSGSAVMRFGSSEYGSGQHLALADIGPELPSRDDCLVVIPAGIQQTRLSWSVESVRPLAGLTQSEPRLKYLPRYALNGLAFRPDTDLLSNSIGSINCCFCMFEYAMVAQFLPTLPGGIEPVELLRRSMDSYIGGKAGHDTRDGVSFHDPRYLSCLDTKPALLFAAWTVIRKTGDLDQLQKWLPHLEKIAELIGETVDEKDGLIVIGKTTLNWSWYDTYRESGKSGYANALGYQAFRYLADLERLAGHKDRASRYDGMADRIKASFVPVLLNPETGIIAGWRGDDGKLYDYWFPWLNGMAITFGLVPDALADQILDRLQAKFKEVGFDRFELGLPNCLVEIPKPIYVNAHKFKQYLNGGATPCFAYWYTQALYQRGRRAEADAIVWPMIGSFDKMFFNGMRGGNLREWHDWDGKIAGGEGFLVDSYLFLNVIYTGQYGITFGPSGYELAPWSPLRGKQSPLGLTFMGKVVDAL